MTSKPRTASALPAVTGKQSGGRFRQNIVTGRRLAWLVLFISVATTAIAWWVLQRHVWLVAQSRFETETAAILSEVMERYRNCERLIGGGRRLFEVVGKPSRSRWREYVAVSSPISSGLGLTDLGFVAYVTQKRLPEFITEMRADECPDFEVKPSGNRPEYFVLQYAEGLNGKTIELGTDEAVHAPWRAAAERSRDTGQTVVSERLDSIPSTTSAPCLVMMQPVYRNGASTKTVAQRQAALLGWVYGRLQINGFLKDVSSRASGLLDFELFDSKTPTSQTLLHDDDGTLHAIPEGHEGALFQRMVLAEMGGRTWSFFFFTQPEFATANRQMEPVFLLVFGLLISGLLFALSRMMTTSREQALRLAEEMNRELHLKEWAIEASYNGIIITDARLPDNPIIYANPAFERSTGYTEAEVYGKNCRFMQGTDTEQPALNEMRAAFEEGRGCRVLLRNYRKDGTLFWNDLSISPIYDPEGRITHYVGVQLDVTEERRFEAELARARDVAVEAARTKSEFLANMSHEIRTPMNGIVGMTNLLSRTSLTPQQQDFVHTIRSSTDALLVILNDILDFSKMEAGKFTFVNVDFDLRATVRSVVDILSEAARSKKLEMAALVHQDLPERLAGDPVRIRQVLINLINNAIKFTGHGEVLIRVTKESESEHHVMVRFTIADTGIGISEEARKKLFKAFSQVDSSSTRRAGGTGLGLAISKKLVELMEGTIGLESTPGQGSTFWFTARFSKRAAPRTDASRVAQSPVITRAKQDAPPSVATSAHCGKRILLVEDNEVNRKVAVLHLDGSGFEVSCATNGLHALRMLEESVYDLILMDCQMPEMDGYTATAEIRRREGDGPHIPIIAMTAHALEGAREKCLASGMDDYISKPLQFEDLDSVIARWLDTGTAASVQPEASAPPTSPAPADTADAPVHLQRLYDVTEGNTDLVRSLVDVYLDDIPKNLGKVRDAVERSSNTEAHHWAHTCKGSSAELGVNRLAAIFLEMEKNAKEGHLDEIPPLCEKAEAEFALVSSFLKTHLDPQ